MTNTKPWEAEEDHAVWVDPATDFDLMVNRAPLGALCGYVGVPPSHPLHGVAYMDLPDLDVHGGVTYTNACQEGGEICHVPEPGREHDIWWIGFDCAHAYDYIPAFEERMAQTMPGWEGNPAARYKTWDYVVAETKRLALQLKTIQEEENTQP